MSLSYSDKVRIQKEVMLGVTPPNDESDEASAWRDSIAADFKKANAAGIALSFPSDWDDDNSDSNAHPPSGDV